MSWFEQDLITCNILKTVCYIDGEEKLVEEYERAVSKILDQPLTTSTSKLNLFNKKSVTLRQEQALRLLEGDIKEYQPKLGNQRDLQGCFNIKVEFYRLPNSVLQELCLFYGITEKGTWKRLNTLRKKKLLSKEGYYQLSNLFDAVLRFRMQAHLFYQMENEILYNFQAQAKLDEPENKRRFELSFKERSKLQVLHKVLLPLLRVAQRFVEQRGKDPCFRKEKIFYDKSLLEQARESSKEAKQAIEMYKKALSLDPNDTTALTELGKIEVKESKRIDSISHLIKALDILTKLHGEDNEQVANQYNELGIIYKDIGKFKEAIDYHEMAVKTYRMLDGQVSTRVARSYRYLGHVYCALGEYAKAEEYYKKELRNYELCKAPVSLFVENYDIFYSFYHSQERFDEAKQIQIKKIKLKETQSPERQENELFQESEKMTHKLGLDYLSDEIAALNFIVRGEKFDDQANIVKAVKYYTTALEILKKNQGENNWKVADIYSRLAKLFLEQKNQGKTIYYCNKALDIYFHNDFSQSDPEHKADGRFFYSWIRVSKIWGILAKSYIDSGNLPKAIENYGKILQKFMDAYFSALIVEAVSMESFSLDYPIYIPTVLRDQGLAYLQCNNSKAAITCLEDALSDYIKAQGKKHPDVAYIYSCAGEAYRKQGLIKKAIKYQEKALEINLLTFGEKDGEIGLNYNLLGRAYLSAKKPTDALACHQKALTILCETKEFGDWHPQVATVYENLAETYQTLEGHTKVEEANKKAQAIRQELSNDKSTTETAHDALAVGSDSTRESKNELAYDANKLSVLERSISYLTHALINNIEFYGKENVPPIHYINLGGSYLEYGKLDKAIEYFQQAFAISYKNRDLINMGKVYHKLGYIFLLTKLRDTEKALAYYEEAITLLSYSDSDYIVLSKNYQEMAEIYREQNNFKEAKDKYCSSRLVAAASLTMQDMDENHPDYKSTQERLLECDKMLQQISGPNSEVDQIYLGKHYQSTGGIYQKGEEYENAQNEYLKALNIYVKWLGKDHPDTKSIRAKMAEVKRSLFYKL